MEIGYVPHCEDKLGPTKDENVCDPDKVASIEFIKKDTKVVKRAELIYIR